jgi:hypothetical protein
MKYNIRFIINLEENLDSDLYKTCPEFNDFLELYNNIQKTSTIPIFNNSTKFNNKNKKMYKNRNNTQCIFIRNSSAWVPNSSTELDKKIKNSIISNLNKLSSENFDKISDILIEDLRKANNENITNIFCHELLNKNIYDKDYQDEYVKLCIKICNININTCEKICEYNAKYYIKKNNDYIGPFDTENNLNEYNNNNFFFKRILLNELYNKFIDRFTGYDEIIASDDSDVRYKKKREIHSILEFICKLFNKGVVDYNIIYLIHLSLLNINCKLDYININIEILYNMWNILINSSVKKFNINHVNNIYSLLHNKFEKIETTYRIKFFVEHLVDTITHKFRNHLIEVDIRSMSMLYNKCEHLTVSCHSVSSEFNSVVDEPVVYESVSCYEDRVVDIEGEIINTLNQNNVYEYISASKTVEEYLDTLIYVVLNNITYIDKCIDCLVKLVNNKLVDNDLVHKIISHSDEEIEEMLLDNNKVKDNFLILKENINNSVIV